MFDITAAITTTVLVLGGTGAGYVPPFTDATLDRYTAPVVSAPYVAKEHRYDGAPWVPPQASAAALNAAVAAAVAARPAGAPPVVVVGLSKGGQVATAAAQRDDAPAPADVRYVTIGNPDGPTGFSTRAGWTPAPGEVRHNADNVFGEYDGFADWPDRFTFGLAEANALMGIGYVHLDYGTGSDTDPLRRLDEADVTVEDNVDADGVANGTTTTTRIVPTRHLPLTRPIRDTLRTFGQGTDGLDAFERHVLRPAVDAGYSRNDADADARVAPAGIRFGGVDPDAVKKEPRKVRGVKEAKTEPRKVRSAAGTD